MDNQRIVAETVRRARGQGMPIDQIVSELRALGLTKMECMIALEDFGGMPHAEAKPAVHQSTAWSHLREAAEQLENDMLAELEKRGRRRPDGTIEL